MFSLHRKLSGWFRRQSIEADLQEEMWTHVEMKARSTGDWHAAQRTFGNRTLLLEDSRNAWGWPRLEAWARDFHFGFRVMSRRPGFAATVLLTLALGIAASSTVFSLVDTVLLRPLPYPDSTRLMAISEGKAADDGDRTPVAPGRLEDWQRLTSTFEAIAGSTTDQLIDSTNAEPERLSAAFVSARFFAVLPMPASIGRTFRPEEERFGGPSVAVISDGLWRRRFGAERTVIGRSLTLPGGRFTIVGVMPPAFQHPSPATEIWIPNRASPDLLTLREARFYRAIGRLKAGVSAQQGQADLAAAQLLLGQQYPKTDAGWTVSVRPLREELTGSVQLALWLLLGSVGLLLLIACANVACLLLAQLNGRTAEFATRLALGSGRIAIARQLLAEGVVYALAGGLLGLLSAFFLVDLLKKHLIGLPRITELSVDLRLLAFALTVSVLAALLFSLAPIFQMLRSDLASKAIRQGRGVLGGSQRLPRFLVTAQLALATVLLVGAGLFLRSLIKLQEAPVGFAPGNVLALRISATQGEQPASAIARHQRTLDLLAALPGITSVAMSSGLPGVNMAWHREFTIVGNPSPDGMLQFAGWRIVTSGYFQTLGIPVREGETCRMKADSNDAFQVLVNSSFANRYFKDRDPVGRTLAGGPIGNSEPRIVGVVADVKENGPSKNTEPIIYACGYLRFWPDSEILIRTVGSPAGMTETILQAIRTAEPARPVYSVRPLTEALDATLAQDRFRTVLVAVFSALALSLAAIGLYGVMSYMVTHRAKEISVRIALGARPGQILADVLRSGGRLAAAGGIVGIALAAGASRLAGTLLYGIGSFDMATYLTAAGVLFTVALLACLIPGHRATVTDPVRALRE